MKTSLMAGGIALLATLGLSSAAFAGPSTDTDGDGVFDVLDNCLTVPNPPTDAGNCDTDNDGYGNRCDGDFDGDYFVFPGDFSIWDCDFQPPNTIPGCPPGTGGSIDSGAGTDMDCDGFVFPSDFTIWDSYFGGSGAPGPSGLSCAGMPGCDL